MSESTASKLRQSFSQQIAEYLANMPSQAPHAYDVGPLGVALVVPEWRVLWYDFEPVPPEIELDIPANVFDEDGCTCRDKPDGLGFRHPCPIHGRLRLEQM